MTCHNHHDVDLAAFVAEPDDPRWQNFRAHYATCAECSAALAPWAELDATLRSTLDAGHPSDEELLAFANRSVSAADAESSPVQVHLQSCAPCRDAVTALSAFELPVAATAPRATETPESVWTRLAAWLGDNPVPTLAAAAVAGLVIFWLLPRLATPPGDPGPPDPAPIAEVPRVSPPEKLAPMQPEPELAPLPEELPIAQETPEPAPAPVPEPVPDPVAEPVVTPKPEVIAESPAPAPSPKPSQENLRLASMGPETLDYVPSRGMPGGRVSAGSRGAAETARVTPLVPTAIGLSLAARPTLYVYISEPTERSIMVTLNDVAAMETLFQEVLPGPHRAGVRGVPSVALEPGRDYQWLVAFEDDPEGAQGAVLRHALPGGPLRASLEAADPESRLRLMAGNGYWYDALDTLSRAIEQDPGAGSLRRARAQLLEAEGLAAPAAADGRGR